MENAKYIEVEAGVRYWEDATVDGNEDANGDLIPCRKGDAWAPVIRLQDGQILDWPQGKEADIHYKVCDSGLYWLLDEAKVRIAKWGGYYVPDDLLCMGSNGYGDYIILKVGGDGKINNWRFNGLDADQWALDAQSIGKVVVNTNAAVGELPDGWVQEFLPGSPANTASATRRATVGAAGNRRSSTTLSRGSIAPCNNRKGIAVATMTDGELLELAAKAAGKVANGDGTIYAGFGSREWNPLADNGDALRLAVDLGIAVTPYPIYGNPKHSVIAKQYRKADVIREANPTEVVEIYGDDEYSATRRAIVRAAAAIALQT